jgi:hypothetical protein
MPLTFTSLGLATAAAAIQWSVKHGVSPTVPDLRFRCWHSEALSGREETSLFGNTHEPSPWATGL